MNEKCGSFQVLSHTRHRGKSCKLETFLVSWPGVESEHFPNTSLQQGFATLFFRRSPTAIILSWFKGRACNNQCLKKGKGLPQQAELAQGVPGRLRPRIFLTFGTTRVVGRQPYAPAAFIPEEIPGTHF